MAEDCLLATKVEKEREWKGKSYAGLVNLSEKDKELQKYLSWIQTRFASEYVGGIPKSEAVDLAGFLQYIDFKGKAGSGYQRKVKKDSELLKRSSGDSPWSVRKEYSVRLQTVLGEMHVQSIC